MLGKESLTKLSMNAIPIIHSPMNEPWTPQPTVHRPTARTQHILTRDDGEQIKAVRVADRRRLTVGQQHRCDQHGHVCKWLASPSTRQLANDPTIDL